MNQDLSQHFKYIQDKISDEGFDYCFRYYSTFGHLEDEKFHSLRESYIKIANELEEYINEKSADLLFE
jgi:hypothetical protein